MDNSLRAKTLCRRLIRFMNSIDDLSFLSSRCYLSSSPSPLPSLLFASSYVESTRFRFSNIADGFLSSSSSMPPRLQVSSILLHLHGTLYYPSPRLSSSLEFFIFIFFLIFLLRGSSLYPPVLRPPLLPGPPPPSYIRLGLLIHRSIANARAIWT